jgi:hypothetical protein
LAHSYCFFLHDECFRALVEYEAARPHLVTINFENQVSAEEFSRLAKEDRVEALVRTGWGAKLMTGNQTDRTRPKVVHWST